MDEALLQYVRKNTYDFDKVCADLKSQFSAKTWMLSTDACRERFASLQAAKDQVAVKDMWTADLDDELRALVRTHTFDFKLVTDDIQDRCK
jgi:hypothetical protein